MVVLIAASGAEMKDLLSIVAEFYLLRNLTQGRKLSMPVPYDNNHLICLVGHRLKPLLNWAYLFVDEHAIEKCQIVALLYLCMR